MPLPHASRPPASPRSFFISPAAETPGSLTTLARTHPRSRLDPALYTDLASFGDDYLEATDVNWYDGDGGGGTLTFDLANKAFSSDVYWNETVMNTGFAENDTLPIDEVGPIAKASGVPARANTSVQP